MYMHGEQYGNETRAAAVDIAVGIRAGFVVVTSLCAFDRCSLVRVY